MIYYISYILHIYVNFGHESLFFAGAGVTFQVISFLKENQFLLSRHMSIQTCRMGSARGVGGNQIIF